MRSGHRSFSTPRSNAPTHIRRVARASSVVGRGPSPVDTSIPENCKALVLDAGFRPLDVVNWHHAVNLDVFRDVEVLEYYDCYVKTVRKDYPIPAVLRSEYLLTSYRRIFRIELSRKNIMKRDRHACIYCGEKKDMTIDHVVPISRGGKCSWENMVAACKTCNTRKGNRSLEQLGWKLRTVPKKPRHLDVRVQTHLPSPGPKEWEEYLGAFREEYDLL